MTDIVLLTASEYVSPDQPDWYVQQILTEDDLLRSALQKRGLRVQRVAWNDPHFDWRSTRAAVFRATWDYTHRYDEFVRWLENVRTKTTLINSFATVRWNLDKHYLRDLSEKGIAVPATVYVERGEATTVQEIIRNHHFRECIIKPAVSGGARHTYKVDEMTAAAHEEMFRLLTANEAMMVQPFLHSVTTIGEKTLVMIGGSFSHAVLKRTKEGDFRVQDDHGGTVHEYAPTGEEIAFAERVIASCDPVPFYGRIDMLMENDGKMVVSELELIEPELWFRFHPPAADFLAEKIYQSLQ